MNERYSLLLEKFITNSLRISKVSIKSKTGKMYKKPSTKLNFKLKGK